MQTEQGMSFGPYRLVGPRGPLFRKSRIVNLPPKALAVLWELVSHAGQVVTKEHLLASVWTDTVVGEETLTAFIGILRRALKDASAQPRYIATVHRQGYRFIAAVTAAPVPSSEFRVPSLETQSSVLSPQHSVLVGRESELAQLHNLFAKALNGERQMVFVAGEAGIGKTTLVEAFLGGIENWELGFGPLPSQSLKPQSESPKPDPWVGWGQCVEHYGAGEAYLPVLEALGQLGRQPNREWLLATLHQYAPTWLAQLPALLSPAELEAVQRRVQGAARERMLREIAEALDVVTAEHPLVLVLEDLHWSDPSTVEVLALLARRREATRLLVLGTYRPVELVVTNHPLKAMKQELVARGQGVEVLLGGLSREAVHSYVSRRVAQAGSHDEITAFVHQRTEGHPLFMVQVTDYLLQQEATEVLTQAVAQTVPDGLQQLIEVQLGRLGAEAQRVLEAASVAGAEFVTASVAAGSQMTTHANDALCEELARRGQFIEERGLATWPDGTVSGRYGFRHALYQQVLYQQIAEARRIRLHQLIGSREEQGFGERAREVAAVLAMHFERGRNYQRAVHYRRQAVDTALQRNAYSEAAMHCTSGLSLLALLPETPERLHHELNLQMVAGVIFAATKGYAAPEVEQAYLRAQSLCEQRGDTQQQIQVLRGLMILYTVRANFPAAREVGERLLPLAQEVNDASLLQLAHMLFGVVWLWLGELSVASEHFSRGASFVDPPQTQEQRRAQAIRNGQDHRVALLAHTAWMLWLLGYPTQAVQQSEEALRVARAIAHPFSEAFALIYEAGVQQFCRVVPNAQQHAAAALQVAEEQGFTFFAARARSIEGWICAQQKRVDEGIIHMRQSLAVYERLGIERGLPHFFADLAEAYAKDGQYEEGEATITKALQLVANTGERWYEAELWRLRGELTLAQSRVQESQKSKVKAQKSKVLTPNSQLPDPTSEAEACFHKAVEIARRQQAKSLELRATVSLARLWQQRGRTREAHRMLSEVYGWFTEGLDTADLREAKALLESLEETAKRGNGEKDKG